MIRAIDIVTIPVRDQDTALKFYTEKLGFKVATNQDFGDGKQRWIELLSPVLRAASLFSRRRVLRIESEASNQ